MTQPGPRGAARAAWLSRLIGASLIIEQAGGHALGARSSDLTLVGAGIFLLTGREGWAATLAAAERVKG